MARGESLMFRGGGKGGSAARTNTDTRAGSTSSSTAVLQLTYRRARAGGHLKLNPIDRFHVPFDLCSARVRKSGGSSFSLIDLFELTGRTTLRSFYYNI